MKLKLISYSFLLTTLFFSETKASENACAVSVKKMGFIGFGVMGTGLVNNAIDRAGFLVTGHDRSIENVASAVLARDNDGKLNVAISYGELVADLPKPRIVMIMVNDRKEIEGADGKKKVILPPDFVIDELYPLLEEGDIVIDGANSHYLDTARRQARFAEKNIHYLGAGISGGEKGALTGPSIMVGGSRDAWEKTKPLFEGIAAKFGKIPMVAYMGPEGSGHFTKMVHNGIEYAELQAIADVVHVLKAFQFSNDELRNLFTSWARDPNISSYLVEKTADLFGAKNKDGSSIVDGIADASNQLGTGRFTVQAAQELGVNADIISAAVNARFMSVLKNDRVALAETYGSLKGSIVSERIEDTVKTYIAKLASSALISARILAFAQGFEVLERASQSFKWNLNLSQIAEIWQAGCILQSPALKTYRHAFAGASSQLLLHNLRVKATLKNLEPDLQQFLEIAGKARIATPVIASAFQYLNGVTTADLPLNVISGLRKIFGDHWFNYTNEAAKAANDGFDWKTLR